MAVTDISICTTALLMVGADEITSFIDETREAKLCAALYDVTKQNMLAMHPWRFSIGQVQLAKLATTPVFGYANAFQLPTNFIAPEDISDNSQTYRIYGDKLFTDLDQVSIAYQFDDPAEAAFPPYFTRLLELELAELLSVALLDDDGKGKLFEIKKDKQMIRARARDSQTQPNIAFQDVNFVLVNVRP